MKKGKLTMCDSKLIGGNIPEYEFENYNDLINLVSVWLESKIDSESVFVCFQSFNKWSYENNHIKLMITHKHAEVWDEVKRYVNCPVDDFVYSIFEFETYKEALKYCIDLKEGL